MTSAIIEAINRAEITKIFLEQGWMVYKPEADIGGVDFLIMNLKSGDEEVRKIQLKSRWTVDKKYYDKNVWVCFPDKGKWYLCKHERMIEIGLQCDLSLWDKKDGQARPNYSSYRMSQKMTMMMSEYRFPAPLKEVL